MFSTGTTVPRSETFLWSSHGFPRYYSTSVLRKIIHTRGASSTFAGKNDCTHSSKNNYIDIHVVLSYNGNAEMAFRAIFTGDEVLGMLDTEGEDGGMDDVFFAGSDEEFGMHEEEIERYMYNNIRRHRYSTWVNSYFLA